MEFHNIPVNELKMAVALSYDGEKAPTIIASGKSEDAKQIIKLALENEIPLCDNPALVDLLSRIELGDEVPAELYHAVAHILAFAYDMTFRDTKEEDVID